jgi:hypothetical protein
MSETSSDSNSSEISLYQEFLAEREEILRHKWLRSEEAQADLGFEAALADWTIHHREQWRKEYLKKKKKG